MTAHTFIQLPMADGPGNPDINYRAGFERRARACGDPAIDTVILYTLDEVEAPDLEALWRDWPNAQVLVAHPCVDGSHAGSPGGTVVAFAAQGEHVRAVSLDAFDAMRWSPGVEPTVLMLPCEDLAEVLRGLRASGGNVHLAVDLRVPEQRAVAALAGEVDEVCAVVADAPYEEAAVVVDGLRTAGLRWAGRPFGVAGASVALHRPGSPAQWATGAVAQARVRGGVAIERWRTATQRVDPLVVPQLEPVTRAEVETIIAAVRRDPDALWRIAVPEEDVAGIAHEAHERLGAWPISFSYPAMLPLAKPTQQLSPIVPGFPYSFTDNAAYLSAYARASMAITFRKAGWDCFRHVEILASGALPLMPDADRIPRYVMVHYPRAAMAALAAQAIGHGGVPDDQTRRDFRAYAERHLTTQAMARYLLGMSGLSDAQRVLFVDDQTPVNPEYQSTLALIGLKQLLGPGCEVAFPADFLYVGSAQTAARHYGRGFGYSHAVDPAARTSAEESGAAGHGLDDLRAYDAVVVGSISRNVELTRRVLEHCDPTRVVLIHGEDGPPTTDELAELRTTGAHAFVRALHPTR